MTVQRNPVLSIDSLNFIIQNRLNLQKTTFLLRISNQARLFQFRPFISPHFAILILNIDHIKDWNMLAKPIWVAMMEKSQSMIGS